MRQLRELCVCDTTGAARIEGIRNILGEDVERYGGAAVEMLQEQNKSQASLFGCFAARKMLESSCVALLSHLDPARLLILREYQLKGDYDLRERQNASIDWRSDVIADKKLSWEESVAPDKFVRALLGGHLAEVAWIHAIDQVPRLPPEVSAESTWIQEIVAQSDQRSAALEERRKASAERDRAQPPAQTQPRAPQQSLTNGTQEKPTPTALRDLTSPSQGMLVTFRTTAQGLFSTLSKGVHLEFVIDHSSIFDNATITQSIKASLKLSTQLAFIFHLMDCTNANMSLNAAAALVMNIERQVEI